jgi:hypothetical protein
MTDVNDIWQEDDQIEPFDRSNKPKENVSKPKIEEEKTTPARGRILPEQKESKWDKYKL